MAGVGNRCNLSPGGKISNAKQSGKHRRDKRSETIERLSMKEKESRNVYILSERIRFLIRNKRNLKKKNTHDNKQPKKLDVHSREICMAIYFFGFSSFEKNINKYIRGSL